MPENKAYDIFSYTIFYFIAKSDNDQTTKSIKSRFVKLVSLLAD